VGGGGGVVAVVGGGVGVDGILGFSQTGHGGKGSMQVQQV